MPTAGKSSSKWALRRPLMLAAATAGCALTAPSALGQTSFAAAAEIVIPLAANVAIYHTQVFVRNPNPSAITVNVRYYQSIDGTAPSGLRSCTPVSLQANESSSFDLGTQCALNGSDDDFGMMILEDASPGKTNVFFASSRTQTPDGIGFTVEGFPIENFSGAPADALGLQNLSVAPNYRSNCFVASLGEAVNWQLDLVQGETDTVIGTASGSLAPFETTRMLDVFTAVGLAGDHTNVRATFSTTDNPAPAFLGFCTLETTANGSADFRVAKSLDMPPSGGGGQTLSTTFNADIASLLTNTGVFEFIGSTGVTLGSSTNLSVYGGGWFAKTSTGIGSVDIGVCYQDQSGPGPLTLMGSTTNFSVNGGATFHYATASATLPAATYTIGLCAQNVGVNNVNKNGTASGFIFTTP